jgi:exonuclease V gamma subunit
VEKECLAVFADMGKVKAKRKIKFWVRHLCLNLEKQVMSTLVLLDKTIFLPALSREEAIKHLQSLHTIAVESKQKLLPFIPDVSLAFAEAKDIIISRDRGWERLNELFGRSYGKEYLLDPRLKEAFGDADNWSDAMMKIPGGEDVFNEISNQVFRPFLDKMREVP